MAFPFIEENTASRQRLENLARRLSEADLAQTTSYGWTVAALLAHLAFWDERVLVLLKRWKESGIDSSPIDSQAVNDSLKPLCHALDPRKAVELCLASAAAADAELENLTPELMGLIEAEMRANPFQFRANRALHRNGHLNDIQELVNG